MGYIINTLLPGYSEGDDTTESPVGIDYKTGLTTRLQERETMVAGELIRVEYFRSYIDGVFVDLVIDVNITYNRNEAGELISRSVLREWYLEDGSPGEHTKTTVKHYTPEKADRADAVRRDNIVNHMLASIGRLGVPDLLTNVQTFFLKHNDAISAYRSSGNVTIINLILVEQEAWLDVVAPGIGAPFRNVIAGMLST